jgi:hypothetical protein
MYIYVIGLHSGDVVFCGVRAEVDGDLNITAETCCLL